MNKSTAGLLIGVGAVLAWFFRGKILGTTFPRSIVLTRKNGTCGIQDEPEPVTLHKVFDDRIRWEVSNPATTGCEGRRTVCIGNWRLDGRPTETPPVTNRNGLCRPIQPGNPPVPILGHINHNAPNGEYTYDILVDDVVVLDPIVKLVL